MAQPADGLEVGQAMVLCSIDVVHLCPLVGAGLATMTDDLATVAIPLQDHAAKPGPVIGQGCGPPTGLALKRHDLLISAIGVEGHIGPWG